MNSRLKNKDIKIKLVDENNKKKSLQSNGTYFDQQKVGDVDVEIDGKSILDMDVYEVFGEVFDELKELDTMIQGVNSSSNGNQLKSIRDRLTAIESRLNILENP